MFRFADLLTKAARQWPDLPAVTCAAGTLSWAGLADRCHRLADVLMARGVGPGDRVAYLGFNGRLGVESLFAAPLLGAISVPLNFRLSDRELIETVNDCRPKAIIVDAAHTDTCARIRKACPSVVCVLAQTPGPDMEGYEDALSVAVPAAKTPSAGEDPLVIFYTGGTTGRSKGVMLSHTNIFANSLGILANWDFGETPVYAFSGPLFHSAAGARIFGTVLTGTHSVLQPRFDVRALFSLIETHRIEIAQFVPTMIAMLLDHPAIGDHDLSSLRLITYGGAPMPPALLNRVLQAFPGVRFAQAFGMTEASPIVTYLNPEDHEDLGSPRLNSVGRPGHFVDLIAVDETGSPLPTGQVGELIVRGPNVMLGYWEQPDLTRQVLRDGWYHTGDAGYLDQDGYVFVSGRINDMIITGGENVYPIEVENVLSLHPAVREVAVIGTPDDKWGERVHAVVVLHQGASETAEGLIAYCRDRLAHYKCPSIVTFWLGPLPLTKVNKTDKIALRAALAPTGEAHD